MEPLDHGLLVRQEVALARSVRYQALVPVVHVLARCPRVPSGGGRKRPPEPFLGQQVQLHVGLAQLSPVLSKEFAGPSRAQGLLGSARAPNWPAARLLVIAAVTSRSVTPRPQKG